VESRGGEPAARACARAGYSRALPIEEPAAVSTALRCDRTSLVCTRMSSLSTTCRAHAGAAA
jgi:hypothetical protein